MVDEQRRRALIVCDIPRTFARFRLPIAKCMQRHGYEVSTIFSQADEDAFQTLRQEGFDVHLVPMNRTGLNPFSDLRYYRQLRSKIAEIDPALLFTYQAKAAVYSSLAARRLPECRRFVLFPGLGYLFSDERTLRKKLVQTLVLTLYRRAFRDVDGVIFQNPDDQETLENLNIFGPQVQRTLVNGSGVSLDEFPLQASVTEPVRFLIAGRILRDKGFGEFAAAARQLRAEYGEKVEFEILGSFDSNPSAIGPEEVEAWENEGILKYSGSVSDVRPYLGNCSVFVLPSYYMEGTPRSILEALATGRPIITTDSRGCRQTVETGVNGFLVEPRSIDSLVAAMRRFADDPSLIEPLGLASRKMAEEKYDVRLVVQQMSEALGLES